VNAVGPGSTATGPFAGLSAERRAEVGSAAFALGRIGEPADTAGVVAFLASEDAGFITGQIIYNVGGQHGPIRLPGDEVRLRCYFGASSWSGWMESSTARACRSSSPAPIWSMIVMASRIWAAARSGRPRWTSVWAESIRVCASR